MKKILALALAFFITTTAGAQWSWGIKAGVNASNFIPNDDVYYDTEMPGHAQGLLGTCEMNEKFGFLGGFYAQYKLGSAVGLQGELFYSRMGGDREVRRNTSTESVDFDVERSKVRLNYLSLPIMLRFYCSPKFSIDLGPQVGLLLRASTYYKGVGNKVSDGTKVVIKEKNVIPSDKRETFDYGAAGGLSYRVTHSAWLSLRAYYGLAEVLYDNDRNLSLQLGMSFKL